MKILLAEDEAAVRLMMARALVTAGYDVTEAVDGAHALQLLGSEGAVDVLVTDIRMPGADGWAVARAYRDRFPDLPVLYITGYADETEPVPGGVIIQKPCRTSQVLAALSELTP